MAVSAVAAAAAGERVHFVVGDTQHATALTSVTIMSQERVISQLGTSQHNKTGRVWSSATRTMMMRNAVVSHVLLFSYAYVCTPPIHLVCDCVYFVTSSMLRATSVNQTHKTTFFI